MSELNFQRDTQIDPDYLDILWVRHPHLYMCYAEANAKANDIVRKKKNDLDLIDSKIDKELRELAEGTKEKLTVDAIKNKITSDTRHIEALMEYNDALYNSDICASAVKAMEHKKTALQALVQLFAAGYFAGPKVAHDLKKIMNIEEAGQAQEKDRVRENIGRRMRKSEENN